MNWTSLLTLLLLLVESTSAFVVRSSTRSSIITTLPNTKSSLCSAPAEMTVEEIDYDEPEDAVVLIKPKAMKRLRELKVKEKTNSLVLRMGVRNGGCTGLSYVMDFSTEDEIQEDDAVDEYCSENIKCVVDAKYMLYYPATNDEVSQSCPVISKSIKARRGRVSRLLSNIVILQQRRMGRGWGKKVDCWSILI